MYEKIAWNNFCKTGNLESFVEYKLLCNELGLGDKLETDKSEGNNNKGDQLQG